MTSVQNSPHHEQFLSCKWSGTQFFPSPPFYKTDGHTAAVVPFIVVSQLFAASVSVWKSCPPPQRNVRPMFHAPIVKGHATGKGPWVRVSPSPFVTIQCLVVNSKGSVSQGFWILFAELRRKGWNQAIYVCKTIFIGIDISV